AEPPTQRQHAGPVPSPEAAAEQEPTTAPQRLRPSGPPSVNTTDRVRGVPAPPDHSALIFKVVTVVLVVAAVGLGGFYVYQQQSKSTQPSVDPHHDVPLPGGDKRVLKPSRPS